MPWRLAWAAYRVGPEGFASPQTAGSPIRRTVFFGIGRRAVGAAEAPAGTGADALGHLGASVLVRHGEPLTTVQPVSATETPNTDGHLWPDSEDQTPSTTCSDVRGRLADVDGRDESRAQVRGLAQPLSSRTAPPTALLLARWRADGPPARAVPDATPPAREQGWTVAPCSPDAAHAGSELAGLQPGDRRTGAVALPPALPRAGGLRSCARGDETRD